MRIVFDLPEDIATRLEAAWPDVSRGALEAVALEGLTCLGFFGPAEA